jgi:hypothetical protein
MMDEAQKFGLLFSQLIIMLHSVGMQQLGRTANPVTNVVARDLDAASSTVDLIAMLRSKTLGNLSAQEEALIDQVLAELREAHAQETRS